MKTEDAIALFASRADMYRQVAQWFFAPLSEEQIDALASQDLRGLAGEDGSPYADGYNDLYRALRLRHTGTRQALAADFTGVFYGATTEGGQTAQPFESLYRCDGGALMGESRGEVYRTLKKARLKVHEGLDLPDDHLSFDAAYEAELCDRAAALLGESDRAGALQVLSEQRAFFEEHIASWFDDFRNRASSMVTTRFYQGILKVTAAFFADEPVLMDDLEKCLSWRRYEE